MQRQSKFAIFDGKVTKKREKSKRKHIFFCFSECKDCKATLYTLG